ncbi:hypothetical protein CR513_44396, partial [Mucuna pruriens]
MAIYCAASRLRASLNALRLSKRHDYAWISSQGSSSESESQPISVSSSSGLEALAVMPKSIMVAEGASSQPPAPIILVSKEVLSYCSDISRSSMASLDTEGGWVQKPYVGKFDLVHCSPAE